MNPKLEAIDNQMMLTSSQANLASNTDSVNASLADAEAKLTAVDKTNLNQYIGLMQQVLMLRQRKSLLVSTTQEQLLAQKVAILEELVNTPTSIN